MKRVISLLLTIIFFTAGFASELSCAVEINYDKVENVRPDVFNSLREAIGEYMNTTSFTSAHYSPVERIECKLFFTVDSYTDNLVSGSLQVQSSRPVYGSSYTTTLLNYKDNDVEFSYIPGDRIEHSETTMTSSLASLLDYYALLIIALDNDSFALRGGDSRLNDAATVVQLARTSGEKGWSGLNDKRNRASVLLSLQEGPSVAIRDMMYNYHRHGLDVMSMTPEKGREVITNALETIRVISASAPMSVVLPIFRDAKLDEIVNIYSGASSDERQLVYKLLIDVYPTENERLEPLTIK